MDGGGGRVWSRGDGGLRPNGSDALHWYDIGCRIPTDNVIPAWCSTGDLIKGDFSTFLPVDCTSTTGGRKFLVRVALTFIKHPSNYSYDHVQDKI
jgi:hypothetical protein